MSGRENPESVARIDAICVSWGFPVQISFFVYKFQNVCFVVQNEYFTVYWEYWWIQSTLNNHVQAASESIKWLQYL